MRVHVLLASVVAVAACSAALAADALDVPARQRQLFLDDYLVDSTSSVPFAVRLYLGAILSPPCFPGA